MAAVLPRPPNGVFWGDEPPLAYVDEVSHLVLDVPPDPEREEPG